MAKLTTKKPILENCSDRDLCLLIANAANKVLPKSLRAKQVFVTAHIPTHDRITTNVCIRIVELLDNGKEVEYIEE